LYESSARTQASINKIHLRRHVWDTRVRHGNGTDDVGTGVPDVQGTGGERGG